MFRLAAHLCGWTLLSLACFGAQAGEDAVVYADPDGAYALLAPKDWKPERSQFSDEGRITEFVPQGTVRNMRFGVVALKPKNKPLPDHLEDNAKMLFNQVLTAIRDDGELVNSRVSKVKYGERDAMRCDLVFKERREAPSWKGEFLVVHGTDHVFLALLSAPEESPDALTNLEKILGTIAFESNKPAETVKTPAPEPLKALKAENITFDALAKPRDPAEKVLVPGPKPLTYGALAAWANLVDHCFDLDLTSQEFTEWSARVMQVYPTLHADEQALIVNSGTTIWKRVLEAKPEEQTRQKLEARALLREFLGVPAHAAWAEPLYDAVHLRDRFIAATLALPPQNEPEPGQPALAVERFDNVFSASDLDATVEMLYFWAAANDAPLAERKLEEYRKDREALAAAYDNFPAVTQLLLANAERVYGKMRADWRNARPSERLELAKVYSGYLGLLGFKESFEKATWVDALKNGAAKMEFGIVVPRKVDRLKDALW